MYKTSVTHVLELSGGIMQVKIQLALGSNFSFREGQYVDMILADGKSRTFSIASSPEDEKELTFHLRDVEDGLLEELLLQHLNEGVEVELDGPKGDFRLGLFDSKPLLMLAGGTGFAPIHSMMEYAMAHNISRQVTLYWGVRSRDELYCDETIKAWARECGWFNYVPVLSHDDWQGRTGLVHEALLADYESLVGHEVYVSGAPQMVKAAYDTFLARGLAENDFYSDILEYAKTV